MTEYTKDGLVEKIKETLDYAAELSAIQQSRELSLVRTKLQEAEMWGETIPNAPAL